MATRTRDDLQNYAQSVRNFSLLFPDPVMDDVCLRVVGANQQRQIVEANC